MIGLTTSSATKTVAVRSMSAGSRPLSIASWIEQVIAEPDRVEADLFSRAGHGDVFSPADAPFDFRQLDADAQRSSRLVAGRVHPAQKAFHAADHMGTADRVKYVERVLCARQLGIDHRLLAHVA